MLPLLWSLLIIIPEGLGLYLGREVSLLFVLGFPVVSLLIDLINRKKIAFPVTISLLWVAFLVLMLLSSIQVAYSQSTLNVLFYNVSLFLTFIYFYNHQDLMTSFIQIILGIGLFFCLYTSITYLGLIFLDYSPLPIPSNGYQFVYSRFGSHNHLGDILVIAVIPAFYYYARYKKVILLAIISLFSLFILGSYSRSAYLSLLTILIFYIIAQRKKIRKSFLYGSLAIVFLLSSLIFIVVKDISSLPLAGDAHQLIRSFGLGDKEISAKRFEFLNQSFQGIVAKPLFGYGPGNFLAASERFTSYGTRTHSAHNIFLDTAVELGLPALLIYLGIICLILRNEQSNPSFITLMIVAFLANSLSDYTYRIYSFLFIFTALTGLSYREKGSYLTTKQLVVLILLSAFLVIYPLYKM